MKKRPLVVLTIFFCLGIILAESVKISLNAAYLLSLLAWSFSLLTAKKSGSGDMGLFLLSFFIGTLHYCNTLVLPGSHIANLCDYRNKAVYALEGCVDSQPEFKNSRTEFVFASRRINSSRLKTDCCGKVLVFIKGRQELDYGDELVLQGNLYRAFSCRGSAHDYSRRRYGDYLKSQGIYAVMQVSTKAHVEVLNARKGQPVKRFVFWLKGKIEEIIHRRLSPVAAGIIDAMVLGEKKNVSPVIYRSMMRSGTVHILVVSGFNVGIVAFILVLLLKLLRIPRGMRFYISAVLIIIYCLITGASNPVVRATVMAIVFMFAYLVKGEPDIYTSCCLAALFILILNPRQLFDVGFQLSFASVISIVWLFPALRALLRLDRLKKRFLKYLADGFLVSLSAWVGTLGFIAFYFKMVSPITVVANLFIVPLASLINLCGFCLVACEFVSYWMVLNFASVTEFLVKLLIQFNGFLISLPKAYFYLP